MIAWFLRVLHSKSLSTHLYMCRLPSSPYLTMRGRNMVLLTYLMVLSCSTFHTSVIRDLIVTCLYISCHRLRLSQICPPVCQKYFDPQEDCVAHLLIYNLTFVNLKLKVSRESSGTKVIRNPKLPGVLNKIDNGGNKIEESIPLFEGD